MSPVSRRRQNIHLGDIVALLPQWEVVVRYFAERLCDDTQESGL